MHDLRVVSSGSRSFERGGEGLIYANPYTRDRELRRDTIYTDFGRHQFGITARETRDTTSKTARHATVRFSPRETRPRFRGHPVPRRRIYHRDTIELELPEIIPSPPIAVVVMPRQTTLRACIYIYVCIPFFDSVSLIDSGTGKSVGNSEKFRPGLQPIFPNPPPIRAGSPSSGIN